MVDLGLETGTQAGLPAEGITIRNYSVMGKVHKVLNLFCGYCEKHIIGLAKNIPLHTNHLNTVLRS